MTLPFVLVATYNLLHSVVVYFLMWKMIKFEFQTYEIKILSSIYICSTNEYLLPRFCICHIKIVDIHCNFPKIICRNPKKQRQLFNHSIKLFLQNKKKDENFTRKWITFVYGSHEIDVFWYKIFENDSSWMSIQYHKNSWFHGHIYGPRHRLTYENDNYK